MPTSATTTTITSTTNRREWWAIEAKANGSDWNAILRLHLQICDRLRASSSWARPS